MTFGARSRRRSTGYGIAADWHLDAAPGRHLDQLDRQLAATRLRTSLATVAALTDATLSTQDLLAVQADMTMIDSAVQCRIPGLVHADIEVAYRHLT